MYTSGLIGEWLLRAEKQPPDLLLQSQVQFT